MVTASTFPLATAPTLLPAALLIPPAIPTTAPPAILIAAPLATLITAPPATLIAAPPATLIATPTTTPPGSLPAKYPYLVIPIAAPLATLITAFAALTTPPSLLA